MNQQRCRSIVISSYSNDNELDNDCGANSLKGYNKLLTVLLARDHADVLQVDNAFLLLWECMNYILPFKKQFCFHFIATCCLPASKVSK